MTTPRRATVRRTAPRRWRHLMGFMLACLLLPVWLVGCSAAGDRPGGTVRLHSIADNDQRFDTRFTHGYYRQEDESSATMVLFEGPPEQPKRAMTVRLFWVPRAGATPLHASATNAAVHYVIFGDDEQTPVAIYSGAGFVFPRERLGRDTMRLRILDTSIRLSDAPEDYQDRIGHGQLTGDIAVTRDHEATHTALVQIHDLIHERLGRPRLVRSE